MKKMWTIASEETIARMEMILENCDEEDRTVIVDTAADMYNSGLMKGAITTLIGAAIPTCAYILNRVCRGHWHKKS